MSRPTSLRLSILIRATSGAVLVLIALLLNAALDGADVYVVPLPQVFLFQPTIGWIPWAVGAAGLLAIALPLKASIALAIAVSTIVMAEWGCSRLALHRYWSNEREWIIGGQETHEILGDKSAANSYCLHERAGEFRALYTIGPDGWRMTPTPTNPKGTVVLVGCSYAYGFGLNDEETFAYRLGGSWPSVKVSNRAFNGWGTNHAKWIVDQSLQERPRPLAVIYGFMADHVRRNGLRKSWFSQFPSMSKWPHYVADRDGVHFRGTATIDDVVDDTKDKVDPNEIEVTVQMILSMRDECRAAGVPFFLLWMRQSWPSAEQPIMDRMTKSGVEIIDIEVGQAKHMFSDSHPNAEGNRKIAQAIIADQRLAFLKQL